MSASPARTLRDRVEAMFKPGDELAFATDAEGEPDVVLLAISRPTWRAVFAIDRAEYTLDRAEYTLDRALQLVELFGFHQAAPPPAIERAIHAAAHQPPKDKPHATNTRPSQRRSRPVARAASAKAGHA